MGLAVADDGAICAALRHVADAAEERMEEIMDANRSDLDRMDPASPMYDRLKLTPERIKDIADGLRNVAGLASPVGEVLSETVRPNGLKISKVRVPFGVIGVIYEARPNVSFDVFGLCFRSGNACVLKGGSDARCSNETITGIIRDVLAAEGFDPDVVIQLPAGHESTQALLQAVGYVDLVIPRGGSSLISFVRDNARVPVIETGAGICHTYFDADGDIDKGARIVFNAKTRRVSVCNALDSLIVHSSRLADLPDLCAPLAAKNVIIYADPRAYTALQGRYNSASQSHSQGTPSACDSYPAALLKEADESSFGTEFLDYKMSLKTVDSIDEALAHIARYSSRHSEAIITENPATAEYFTRRVDAACVYTNASTAFTDGAQFGFGAEIGISTQKLHARGPMALPELTTYKYIITGTGQTRPA